MTLSPATVRTVLGDVPRTALGRTDYHEHLLQSSPLLEGDELDDVGRSGDEAARLRSSGFDALVELTPLGLGRDPVGLVEISQRTGLHIIAATGVHHHRHYRTDHPVHGWDEQTLADCFVTELVTGLYPDPFAQARRVVARAGVIKVGIDYWEIGDFERRVLNAAGEAHRRTGAPVVCHLELGTAAWEAAELLERSGVDRHKLVLAHIDRNPDAGLHTELAQSGVYLGYDGAARAKYWPDSVLIECLLAVADQGQEDQLLLGGDVARRTSFIAYGGMPGMEYLGKRFVPRLLEAAGPGLVDRVLVQNPARAFSFAQVS